ncbi:MAG TPA: Sec-independent protein translocase subunit TatA [Streptosporangiaceae bacterium]|jgi:sec-independent protein translocase protein TatA|nr:Sec-independent protein translocase subunit TatA [Streptosporangiaceae bacterium]
MPNLGAGEWLIILLVIVVLFGSAKLPTLARSLGKSMRILKAETKGLRTDDDDSQPEPSAQDQQPAETPQTKELQDRAARLRAEAARLDHEATKGDDGTTLNGMPLSDAERARRNN